MPSPKKADAVWLGTHSSGDAKAPSFPPRTIMRTGRPPSKAASSMVRIRAPNSMVSTWVPAKASDTSSRESGSATSVSSWIPAKAWAPMAFTPSGTTTSRSVAWPLKAASSICAVPGRTEYAGRGAARAA